MVNEGSTEQKLKETCVQVGEHLYVRPGSEINIAPLENEEKRNIQIVFSMGGGGIRLKHITKDKYSKHLILVGGKPLSRHVVDIWLTSGFKDFCILTDDTHRGKSVADYYKDGKQMGAEINYSIEHTRLSSGGAIRLGIERGVITKHFINHFPDDLIVNYPNFADDFAKVFLAAIKTGFQCVLVCAPGKLYPYGVVEDKDGKVVDFVEKPFIAKDTNMGVFGLSEEAFPLLKQLEPDKAVKIERTVLKQLARDGKMFKVLLPTEYWIPVNDEPNLNKFIEIVKKK